MADFILSALPPTGTFKPRQINLFCFKLCLDEEDKQTGYYSGKPCGKTPSTSPRRVSPTWCLTSGLRILTMSMTCATLLSWMPQKASNRNTNLNPISVETLAATMEAVFKAVEEAIGETMSDRYGIMLDGWPHGTERYYPLLSLASVMDEPDDHLTILMAIRQLSNSIDGCLFLVGDNCGVNKRLTNLVEVPLAGRVSHRLNLTVREYLGPHDSILEDV
ncbi:hypothetical protein PHMEG_0009506 [Phytophthora megakarya]|uniref:Uncharacterized protein n=1 Tax=Phytophthora megakarya TaxID=4795 RepID=A0A225WHU1_9STRA|nr:hypothetical protein PHMEG_0009506 [Phytophthora megakarya]